MAGTDSSQANRGAAPDHSGPVVVLVRPQLGENIGTVARAMLNCGLTELRLVEPRDGWPNEKAVAASSGATAVIDNVAVFESTGAAIADLQRVWATTARPRDMVKQVWGPRATAVEMRRIAGLGQRFGLMFGPERAGLVNDDIALADAVLEVPLNPAFRSLNLAQAVLLVAWEWYALDDAVAAEAESARLVTGPSEVADKDLLLNFFHRFEKALDESGFLGLPDKRPSMVRNIRNMLQRAALTRQEVQTLHGIISALWERPRALAAARQEQPRNPVSSPSPADQDPRQ